MKRLMYTMLAGLILSPVLAPALRAQDDTDAAAAAPEAEAADQQKAPDTSQWKDKLGLTDEQVTQLKAAWQTRKDAMKPLWDSMKPLQEAVKKDIETLRQQVKAKAGDADIQTTLDQMEKDHQAVRDQMDKNKDAMQAAMKAYKDSVNAITPALTSTQKAKMLLGMMHRMHERQEHKGHGNKNKDADSGSGSGS